MKTIWRENVSGITPKMAQASHHINTTTNGGCTNPALRTYKDLMFEDGLWQIYSAGLDTWSQRKGWVSIIAHHCENVKGAPYWMLIEHHRDPTRCVYCKDVMPASVITLFKLQNMDMIHGS
jgi:hypothetical protein